MEREGWERWRGRDGREHSELEGVDNVLITGGLVTVVSSGMCQDRDHTG